MLAFRFFGSRSTLEYTCSACCSVAVVSAICTTSAIVRRDVARSASAVRLIRSLRPVLPSTESSSSLLDTRNVLGLSSGLLPRPPTSSIPRRFALFLTTSARLGTAAPRGSTFQVIRKGQSARNEPTVRFSPFSRSPHLLPVLGPSARDLS